VGQGLNEMPTFEVDGMKLIKRIASVARDGKLVKVFYPVFPSDRNAGDVIGWLGASR